MAKNAPKLECSGVPDDTIWELHRQAEACLQGTVQLATALDQRATATSGILGAGALALLALVAGIIERSAALTPFVIGATTAAVMFFIGALFCAWAARSTDFFVVGYEPRLLIKAASDKNWMLRYAVEDIQVRIDNNRLVQERSSRLFKWGRHVGLFAIPFGIATFLLAFLSYPRLPF